MIQITVSEAVHGNHDITGHYLYVVKDGETVFYVDLSNHPTSRLCEHLGMDGPHMTDRLGQIILDNQPGSSQWQFEMYTLAECLPMVTEHCDIETYTRMYQDRRWLRASMEMAEQALITHYQPCLNSNKAHGYRHRVPEKYIKRKIANAGALQD